MEVVKTLKLRIKDKHQRRLHQWRVRSILSGISATRPAPKRYVSATNSLSGYDLQKLTDGFSKCDGVVIGSATTQQVCEEYATRRRQFKRATAQLARLQSRSPPSGPWAGFHSSPAPLRYKAGQVHFAGQQLSLWDSYGLANYDLRAGSFCEDSRGRWYLNVQVKIPELVGPCTCQLPHRVRLA
jgi:putative transposase